MKFTLKDYQEEAVVKVLSNLRVAAKSWHEGGRKHAFSLTATTGAGKTVMAAAAFEALFHGDDNYDFEADPGAVVIWFSDDPSLNRQTCFRLLEASDRLKLNDLEIVKSKFCQAKFEARKIYFLNTQKLGKNSLLVRGQGQDPDVSDKLGQEVLFSDSPPDRRSYTIWDTIQNTIEDSSLTLYLVLDEAHRGMGRGTKKTQKDRSTIVKRLINGSGVVPAIPVVWGISATVERFNNAVAEAEGRSTLPNVVVDSEKVQESGLLKDTIILDIPNEVGKFDTVLVRRATEKIKVSTAAWEQYAQQQDDAEVVVPLMVLQVPNTPDPEKIGLQLDTIFLHWPKLKSDSIAHVFGEHKMQTFGGHSVPYLSPEYVQENTSIRVLIAKDAISTGWDCPRAEVMVSFRPAKDRTHITQLLGRMVRTPLARRIPGNDRLNSIDCLLPFFDTKAVEDVANALMKGGFDEGNSPIPGRRILINPIEVKHNPDIGQAVWEKYRSLPAQALPQKTAKPVKRLTALAQEFAYDNLITDAGKKAHAQMHRVLGSVQVLYTDEIVDARNAVLTVEGKTLTADMYGNGKSFDYFVEEADYVVIEDAYRRAARGISPDLARTFSEYLANLNDEAESMEEALIEAHADIAALGLVPEVQEHLDKEADKLSEKWLEKYRVSIKGLSDERQEAYRSLERWSNKPSDIYLAQPNSWMVATTALENGKERLLETYQNHLMCNKKNGLFAANLNNLEKKILETEMTRDDFIAWYRNPSRGSQDSLGIAYMEDHQFRIVRPDFIFFGIGVYGEVVADIVDPHGHHLSDALPKLKGLAEYAETHGQIYRRLEAVSEVNGQLRVLDLTDEKLRAEIQKTESAKNLYLSEFAYDYM